jgi:hypothetical protein
MKYTIVFGVASLLVVAAIFGINGCSIIGFTIGTISDASKPDTLTVPGWKMELIEVGRPISILLEDGSWVSGRFAGMVRVPEADYATRYSAFRRQKTGQFLLPALGDNVAITLQNGVQGEREFLGFDYHYPAVKEEAEAMSALAAPNYVVSVGSLEDTPTGKVLTSEIDKITHGEGNDLTKEELAELISQGQIPLLSAIAVEQQADTTRVAMDQVCQIDVKAKKTGAKTGFVVGAFIDLIVIAVAVASGDSDSKPKQEEPGDIMCGCPFVYSHDGEKYVLDSEAFGGSIFEAAKRTDLGRLDNLREVDHICRLKIVDELQETDYVDEVKLLVVDHPIGTEVVPSLACRLHTLSNPQAPANAVDWRGNNVIDLIREKDGRFWVSDPFGRDPNIKTHARDRLDLEFPRPADAGFVKLAFNVQNTLWAAHLQSHFLELHGSELDNWYQLLNTSAEAREEFQKVMIREGMLIIELWNGEEWQSSGFVWEVGASVFRDQLVWLDISSIPGEVLRVRLECPPGFWMINSVHADYTPDLPFETVEIAPSAAKDHLRRDLEQTLRNTDGVYHVMFTGDWAELTFPVPPHREGFSRSFLVKSSGYYTINVLAEGQPQADLIDRFMAEPSAFGQYTLELLNGYLASAFASSQKR